jgi:hypothetical protein
MKKLLLGLVVFASTMLLAQSSFDGTWRFTPQSGQFGGKPDIYSLQNGTYRCESCVPKVEVKADGEDHKVSGSPYYDTLNVKATDDHTIEMVSKKNGKTVGTSRMSASEDGKTLTSTFTFVSENGQKGGGTVTSTRLAAAPAGANKVSGTWRTSKMDSASENMITVTYKVTDGGLSMSDPTGDSYTAKFDGKDYPYKGDPGTTSVSLKKINDNTIEETDKRNGKVISVSRLTVSPDGKTMKLEGEDKLHGTTFKFEGTKQ